jgi:hypothetical protein
MHFEYETAELAPPYPIGVYSAETFQLRKVNRFSGGRETKALDL